MRLLSLALTLATGAAVPAGAVAQDTTETITQDSAVLELPPPARAAQDSLATSDLQALFSRIDELREVSVTVDGGVATLTGRAPDLEARSTAERLATGSDGVVYVSNRIGVERTLAARTGAVLTELRTSSLDLVARAPILLAAILIVIAFGMLARALSSLQWLQRAFGGSPFAVDLTRRATRLVVWAIGILLALQLLDVTAVVSALLGAAGVTGIAFGFAFRNIAENWLAGVLLSVRRPFEPDDDVSIAGNVGRVIRLTNSDTVLMTAAGNHLRIPNATVYNGSVENYSRNPRRMMQLELSIPRDARVERARAAILQSLAEAPVLPDPEPRVLVVEVGDSHLVVELRAWVDQRGTNFGRARSLVYELAKDALATSGVGGPISEHTVHLDPEAQEVEDPVDVRPGVTVDAIAEADLASDDLAHQVAADRRRSTDVDLLT